MSFSWTYVNTPVKIANSRLHSTDSTSASVEWRTLIGRTLSVTYSQHAHPTCQHWGRRPSDEAAQIPTPKHTSQQTYSQCNPVIIIIRHWDRSTNLLLTSSANWGVGSPPNFMKSDRPLICSGECQSRCNDIMQLFCTTTFHQDRTSGHQWISF